MKKWCSNIRKSFSLNLDDEIKRMEAKGIVHGLRTKSDLNDAASAYKDIDKVIALESDMVKVKIKLEPIVVKKDEYWQFFSGKGR